MKNIHILPTDKQSRLFKHNLDDEFLNICKHFLHRNYGQNIYITSDEEIKEGDWLLSIFDGKIQYLDKCTEVDKTVDLAYNGNLIKWTSSKHCNKIILTTDQDLIADGVQSIDDDFLEWFVKNPSCEMVEIDSTCKCVTCNSSVKSSCDYAYKCRPQIFYKIIIPQEEQTKCYCGHTSFCDCGPKEETKQEQDKKMYSEQELRNAMNWMLTQYFEFYEWSAMGRVNHYIQTIKQQEQTEL